MLYYLIIDGVALLVGSDRESAQADFTDAMINDEYKGLTLSLDQSDNAGRIKRILHSDPW
jgi:hypothetical protein